MPIERARQAEPDPHAQERCGNVSISVVEFTMTITIPKRGPDGPKLKKNKC